MGCKLEVVVEGVGIALALLHELGVNEFYPVVREADDGPRAFPIGAKESGKSVWVVLVWGGTVGNEVARVV